MTIIFIAVIFAACYGLIVESTIGDLKRERSALEDRVQDLEISLRQANLHGRACFPAPEPISNARSCAIPITPATLDALTAPDAEAP